MLGDARIGANVPVSSLDEAVAFYEGKLGLRLFERGEQQPYARFAGAGETKLGIYENATAGQARHTLASFVVDDVRASVDALKANGVVFEEYDLPGMKTEDGVAAVGDMRVAWLKDPDGNNPLFTDACVEALGLQPATLELVRHVERLHDAGDVVAYVADLEARWKREQERRRVRVEADEASFTVDVTVPAGAELVREFLTSPPKRLLWQVDAIEQADLGGRRAAGTASVCVDGRARIYEEILDWRPFEYFTERISLPRGVRAVLTTELQPGEGRTRIVTRVRRDAGARLAWLTASRRLRRTLGSRYGRLAGLVAAQVPEERRLPLATV